MDPEHSVLSRYDFYTSKVDPDVQELWSVLYLSFIVNVSYLGFYSSITIRLFHNSLKMDNCFQRKCITFHVTFGILIFGYMGTVLSFSFLLVFTL